MGIKNSYLYNHIPALYRKTALDIMIYTFIDAQRFTIPGISVKNSATAFMAHYKIDEGELSLDKIIKTFNRIQKELFDEERTQ